MYYFCYHTKPASKHTDSAKLGGAVANVFVDVADPASAELRARQYLAGQLWDVISLDQTGEVKDKRNFEHDKMLVDLYQQAKHHGIACMMVAYPIGGDVPSINREVETTNSTSDNEPVNTKLNPSDKDKNELTETELNRRCTLIIDKFGGINPSFEAFYIHSILYSADRSRRAFERFAEAASSADNAQNQVSLIHEALGHASSLSRFFWPSKIGSRKMQMLTSLKEARAAKLRQSFGLNDDSALKNRRLRDFLEHFDERLDQYLLQNDTGYFFPDAMIGDAALAEDKTGHVFKLVDPASSSFILLGEKHVFEGIRKEVYRIYDRAQSMDRDGCRLQK